jgi:hypothetical protein
MKCIYKKLMMFHGPMANTAPDGLCKFKFRTELNVLCLHTEAQTLHCVEGESQAALSDARWKMTRIHPRSKGSI